MSIFDALRNATISIRKPDGTVHDAIKATVSEGKITFDHQNILLESGDLIQRKMSNGGEETFEVIDPSFHESFHSIPAHYQASVRKLGIPEARSKIESMTINITGHNARVNTNSIDMSTNTVETEISTKIDALREAVANLNLSQDEHQEAMELVDSIQSQFESGKPNKTVLKTLLGALPHAANVSSIGSFLLGLV